MARAIWTGSISFGLLNVPVKLYSAVSKKNVSFRELRESDSSRIRHKRVAEADGKEVPYEDIVKGYEISPENYVVMTKDDFEEIDPKKTRSIEIQDFVDLDQIDPIYFDHPYYLGPDKGAERAYALLTKAMNEQKKVAVARFVLRNKENLAAIRPMGDVLTMATMRFADEVVAPDEISEILGEETESPRKAEVDMAKQLIESLSNDFEPGAYKDEYREELLALIERKAKGEESSRPRPRRPSPQRPRTSWPRSRRASPRSSPSRSAKAAASDQEEGAGEEEGAGQEDQGQVPPSSLVGRGTYRSPGRRPDALPLEPRQGPLAEDGQPRARPSTTTRGSPRL